MKDSHRLKNDNKSLKLILTQIEINDVHHILVIHIRKTWQKFEDAKDSLPLSQIQPKLIQHQSIYNILKNLISK